MAWTVAFALLGALRVSMLVAPALATVLFRRNARQWRNPVMEFLTARYRSALTRAVNWRWLTVGIALISFAATIYLAFSGVNTELRVSAASSTRGAIWVRGTLAPSTGPTERAGW